MLPFRRPDRIVALDDADIVESHELALEDDVEMELDLGDAVEVRNAIQPHAFLQPNTRLFRLTEELPVSRPLTLKTPTQAIRPAVIAAGIAAGMQQTHPYVDDDDDEEEELTAVQPPSARHQKNGHSLSQITPSPFVRTFVSQESLAPVAVSNYVSNYPEPTFTDSPSRPRLRFERLDDEQRMESALEQRELREMTGTPSTRVLRGVALMLMGGVAAAAMTAYVLRDEGGQSGPNAGRGATASEIAPPPPMASIMLPKDAILIGDAPPQQVETRLGARPIIAPPEPPTVLKFGDGDALLVTPPAASAPPAPPASVVISSSGSSGANGVSHASPPKARKPSRPLAPNALLPDSDPPSYALPPSRGGPPKDPVAEAQLRASMR